MRSEFRMSVRGTADRARTELMTRNRLLKVLAASAVALTGPVAGAQAATYTVNPIADTYVKQASPNSPYGTASTLQTDQGTGVNEHAYLKFDLSRIPAGETITGARLSVYVKNASGNGPAVYPTATGWGESALTWNSRSTAAGRAGSAVGNFGSSSSYRRTSAAVKVTAKGMVSLELAPESTDGFDFTSREGTSTDRPQLIVTTTTTTTASPTPTPTPTPTPQPTSSTTPQPNGPSGVWNLRFSDDFNGTTLSNRWAPSWFNGGRMNNTYTSPANVRVENGNAVLRLSSSTMGALINTNPDDPNAGEPFEFTTGYAEARIYFPGEGETIYNFPAWWTNGGNDGYRDGEHDIAEGLGVMSSNYHYDNGFGHVANNRTIPGIWSNAYHTYGVHRKGSSADVYFDGQLVRSYTTYDNAAPHYLIFNVGYRTSSGGKNVIGAASEMKIDYVRVWQE